MSRAPLFSRVQMQSESVHAGAFESNPTFVDPIDPDLTFGLYDLEDEVRLPMVERMMRNMPALKEAGIRSLICGPESFTPDGKPILGETPEVRGMLLLTAIGTLWLFSLSLSHFPIITVVQIRGLYLNCGMNSKGAQLSGGMGREAAALVADGAPTTDVSGYDPARFDPGCAADDEWRRATSQEAEVRNVCWDNAV